MGASQKDLRTVAAIRSRPIALVFRLISLLLAVTGLVRITGVLTGEPVWNALLFYTVQSNLLCAAWLLLLVVRTVRELGRSGTHGTSTPSARWSGAVMMAITVTMVVYLVVLLPAAFQQAGDYEPFSLTDTLIHVLTPCLLILDWLLFVPKGSFRWFDPLLWAAIPYAYLAFALIAGRIGVEFYPGLTYPYPFLDVAALGAGGVAVWVLVLTVGIEAIGYLYLLVDRLLGRVPDRANRRVSSRSVGGEP